jgi:chromate transporter
VDTTVVEVFLVFAKLGLLSVGGGTSMLAEMQREAVGRGWLTQSQFVEAYAIGQMTPGPGSLFVVPMGYQAAGISGGYRPIKP